MLRGREAIGIDLDAEGRPLFVHHRPSKGDGEEARVGAKVVLANCAPLKLADMLAEPHRERLARAYGARALSISLFTAHFGVNAPPATFGLDSYTVIALPSWSRKLSDVARSSHLMGGDPGGDMPMFGIANYGALPGALSDEGPTLVTLVGPDRASNWAKLSAEDEAARRERWLDALLGELDRLYPGIAEAVTVKVLLNARSMQNYLHTPKGAVYGFAPVPPKRGIWAGAPRSCKTPVPGLFLASAFGGAGGFTGAMMSGAQAARAAAKHL